MTLTSRTMHLTTPIKICFLLLLVVFAKTVMCQNEVKEIGINPQINFLPSEYKANGQNFSIAKDKRGLMYFANFSGILEYDGANWKLITTKDISKVNTISVDTDGRVFVGARGEIGYLRPNEKGDMRFESLTEKLDKKTSFPDVIKCFS